MRPVTFFRIGSIIFATLFLTDPARGQVKYPEDSSIPKILNSPSGAVWEGLGPSGITAEDLTYHPKIPGQVFLSSPDGLYRSHDSGRSWQVVSNEKTFFLRADPFNPHVLLAATRLGLTRSTDSGLTWSVVYSPDPGHLVCGTYDAGQPGVVYMGVYFADCFVEAMWIVKSEDGGLTWREVYHQGGTISGFFDLMVDPTDNSVFAASGSGIKRSKDGGTSWYPLNYGLVGSAQDLEPLFGGLIGAVTSSGFFIHPSGSKFWIPIANELTGKHCHHLTPGPAPGIFYCIEYRYPEKDLVYRSDDCCLSWSVCSDVAGHEWIECLTVNRHAPQGSEEVLVGTKGLGPFRSSDQGKSWQLSSSGIDIGLECISVATGPPGSDLVFVGGSSFLYLPGFFRSRDRGQTWEISNSGLPVWNIDNICLHPFNTRTLYVCCGPYGLYRSRNRGDSWSRLTTGLPPTGTFRFVQVTGDGILYSGHEDGFFQSDDGGDTWHYAGISFEGGIVVDLASDPIAGAPSPAIFAVPWGCGVLPEGVYKRNDDAATWSMSLPSNRHFDQVAVGVGGDLVFATDNGVLYRSLDGGGSWNQCPAADARAVAAARYSSRFVAGGRKDACVSIDGGTSWTSPSGLPLGTFFDVNDFAFPEPGFGKEFLYAATSRGVFHLVPGK